MALLDYLGLGSLTQAQPLSSSPTSVQNTSAAIPRFAQPYVEDILGRSYALTTQTPYMPYAGERVAGFTPLQEQAFSQIGSMQPSAQLGQAAGITSDVASQAAGQGPYQALNAQTPNFIDPGIAGAYMSPYMQNVVDWQKQQAVSDFNRQMPYMQAQAVGSGAYGGSRQAVQQAEANRNLQNTLAGIQASGTQNAYQQGQQAFQADAARQLQATQMGEQSRQFGAGLGQQNRQQQLAAAGQLGQLGQQQYVQQMGINTAQQQAGAQQQALAQQGLQNQYQDYLTNLQYPYQQLQFQKSMLSGLPGISASNTTQTGYTAAPSMLAQTAGLLGGIGSLYGAYTRANAPTAPIG